MTQSFSTVFGLSSAPARKTWLTRHYPTRLESVIAQIWAEAERREHRDPHTVDIVAAVARDLAALWQDHELEAIALRIEASMQRAVGQHETALLRYRAAIDLYQQLQLTKEAAQATVGPLDTMMYLGQYEQALQLANWAIAQMRTLGDDAVLARLLVNQGNLYARMANYHPAQKAYAEARQLFTTLDEPQHIAMVAANEANILTNLNEFRQAEEQYQSARTHFVAAEQSNAVAHIDHNLAYLAFAQGDYQRALQRFAEARTAFATMESPMDVAYVDLYRAEIYLALNLWPEVLEVTRTAHPVFAEARMQWEVGQLLLIEAVALLRLDHQDSAEALLMQAHQQFAAEQNTLWLAVAEANQGILAWHQGEPQRAQHLLQQSLQTFQQIGVPSRAVRCAVALGELALDVGDLRQATAQFQTALNTLGDTPLPTITYACHFGLGRIYAQQGESAAAIAQYQLAVDHIERAQATIGAEDYKMAFRRDKLPVYEALILLYLEQNTTEAIDAAFALVERAKSRSLLDTMARIDEENTLGIPEEFWAHYASLKRELNWYYHRLHEPPQTTRQHEEQQRSWRGLLRQYEAKLEKLWGQWQNPDLIGAPRNPVWTVSSATIKQALPADTLLLEFYATERYLLVFGLSRQQLWSRTLPVTPTMLSQMLDQLRFQMNKFSYGHAYRSRHVAVLLQSVNAVLHTLYTHLLAPLPEIHNAEHLIVVPHGLLHYVPFHALWQNGRYLIETHALSYAPSATVLHRVLMNESLTPTDPPLFLGLSDSTIPHVEAELTGLHQLFPAAQVHWGQEATMSKLQAQQGRPAFLHLSTHAMFRQDNPAFSALQLADGWLTVNEIYNLATAAPLVTLSACETGRNAIVPGDELMGLCRGFFGLGTQSLVVSLWRVEDRSTADLMVHFYRALRAGESVYRALRMAQLAIMETHQHPYYWAPFLLTGNPLLRIAA